MPAVYRPLRRRATSAPFAFAPFAALALAVLAIGCGGEDAVAPAASPAAPVERVERVEPYELDQLVRSRDFRAIAIAPGGAILATDSTRRTLLFPAGERRPRELSRDARLEPLALYPDGVRVLVAERAAPGAGAPRLFRLEPGGARTPLPLAPAPARFLGWRGDGAAFFVADESRGAAPGGESLFEIAADTLVAEGAGDFQPGFRVEAVSADGRRIALRRELHPEADELYLAERETGEIRLLLPTAGDGRFRPAAFSSDGLRLLLLTDEGSERLELEWIALDTGARRRLPAPECEPFAARLSGDEAVLVATTSCGGVRRVERFDAGSGSRLPLPPLPSGARALDLTAAAGAAAAAVWTVGGARLPRDLLRQGSPVEALEPLTWGLSPGIDPARLSSPATSDAGGAGGRLPLELWPGDPARSPAIARSAIVWIEDDAEPPAWGEFHPLFQFLAARSVAVARLRLRGSDGFGRAFRHAADGRPLAAAIEDVESARSALASRGVDPRRVALVGVGGWPGAVVATLATNGVPEAGRFAAYAAFGSDPDPLWRLDEIALLPEPARSFWTARIGEAAGGGALAARLATSAARRADPAAATPSAPFLESAGEPDLEQVWRHFSPVLLPR